MKPSGAHTHPGGGSGAGSAAAVVLAAIAGVAIAGPVIRAAVSLLETVLLVGAVILGVGLVGGIALVAWRLRPGRRSTPLLVHRETPVTYQAAESLPAPRRPAIERPAEVHYHFHGVTPEDVAAAIAAARRNDQ